MSHILILDDEERMAETLMKGLTKAGYQTTWIASGLQLIPKTLSQYDLVILDWMLPGISGVDLLRNWRRAGYKIPIIMLTAKNATQDKVNALEFGADDYVNKFFEWNELLARIRVLLRRNKEKQIEKNSKITLDLENQVFKEEGQIIHLTPKEFAFLKYFFDHPNKLITHSDLIRAVYDSEETPYSNVIARHIKSIRKKFKYDPIKTARGFGYRLQSFEEL